ncbi:hypothetical protein [Parasitella parasitica]|uniref:Nuclear transport factor 2 n=1 Tax=Parasitella parasitica TaxID=35722 RepID=A0A0B7NKN1_9FUNG|nr:hypothetical protein [Parasitella parasitica]
MADINAVAKAFTEFYYRTFDNDREQLYSLYRDFSMLTFEGQQFSGANNIKTKLVVSMHHEVSTTDAQPAGPAGDIIVLVTGALRIDEEPNPQMFSQTFHLIPENDSYYVLNDIFRLNYGV